MQPYMTQSALAAEVCGYLILGPSITHIQMDFKFSFHTENEYSSVISDRNAGRVDQLMQIRCENEPARPMPGLGSRGEYGWPFNGYLQSSRTFDSISYPSVSSAMFGPSGPTRPSTRIKAELSAVKDVGCTMLLRNQIPTYCTCTGLRQDLSLHGYGASSIMLQP